MSLSTTIAESIEQLRKQFDKVRREIAKLKEQIADIESRPLDPDGAEARLRALLTAERERGIPTTGYEKSATLDHFAERIARGAEISNWTSVFVARCFSHVEGGDTAGSANHLQADLLPVLLMLFFDHIVEMLVPLVRAHAEENGGMPEAERQQELDKLRSKLRTKEEQEEEIIAEAEINDIWIFRRRPDCDPAIVLGFTDEKEATA